MCNTYTLNLAEKRLIKIIIWFLRYEMSVKKVVHNTYTFLLIWRVDESQHVCRHFFLTCEQLKRTWAHSFAPSSIHRVSQGKSIAYRRGIFTINFRRQLIQCNVSVCGWRNVGRVQCARCVSVCVMGAMTLFSNYICYHFVSASCNLLLAAAGKTFHITRLDISFSSLMWRDAFFSLVFFLSLLLVCLCIDFY